ncbi:cytochrome c oxidase assembly protein [Sphingomonas cannabina]|uniref:cytochrome c oxidase assembly protein n=1 Tax=Sphingomonas cannabina TaxID=2899123 RepID=UPI001F44A42D|nr:cytochrome c oxidase assembly protein [Sphingomonas cannabina]UIJ44838.1 cytochrome c oxidase assembly protein [Sphingomonas cannabina]
MPRLILLLALLLAPGLAAAHDGAHPVDSGPPGWTLDPSVTVPLALALLAYLIGFVRLGARRSLWRNAVIFLAGWLVLTLALVSPLHEAGERSFTLHMIEHELIMLVAALLLPMSRPLGVMLWALPRKGRQALAPAGRWLSGLADPVLATALQGVALWAWHAPPLFNRALGHPAWHVAQHLSFLVTALLFWWAILRTPNRSLAALCLFVTSIVGGALGALMALSSSPWYAGYAAMGMMPFGLTPEEDQALAGLIMWVPGGLVHVGAALLILGRYIAGGVAILPISRTQQTAPPAIASPKE